MTDFRALCAELVDDLELCDWPYKLKETIRADIDRARAVLARWGTSNLAETRSSLGGMPTPVPADKGEVEELVVDELVKRLRTKAATEKLNRCHYSAILLARAANLLEQRHPAPVPVSERLPVPGDCDAEGRCWLRGKVEGDWRLLDPNNSGVPQLKYCFSHWLPAHALPLPGQEVR